MKVAVFSDVQGNLPAMEVVVEDILSWQPDLVVMNGDLVNRGPNSLDCLQLFQNLNRQWGWLAISGNHERYILDCRRPEPDPLEAELRSFAEWTYLQLGSAVDELESWPDHLTFEAGQQWVHITHGTLAGNRNGISQSVPDEALHGKIPLEIALFVTAHTHKALQRQYMDTKILNVGSAGSPFDGDIRASYGRLIFDGQEWLTEIIRLPYDRARSERDYHRTGFLEQAGPLAQIIFEEWRRATLLMPHWKNAYRPAVLRGEISLQRSVECFLAGIDSRSR